MRQGRAQDADRAPQRAVDGGLPGGFVELRETARRRATGVDDQQIEATERFDRGCHGVGRTVRRREVGRDGECFEAGRRGIEPIARAGRQSDLGTLRAQRRRDGATESTAATPDERSCAVQPESPYDRLLPPTD